MDSSLQVLSEEQLKFLTLAKCLHNSTLNANGEVDVEGDVNFSYTPITHIPVQFGYVSGNFRCSGNKLTSLEGAPREVGGDFWCNQNKLTSLEGVPSKVGGDFSGSFSNLTSLKGAPREVGGNFRCYNNNLTSLEGAPREVGGNFYCCDNNLTSLEGAPSRLGGILNFDNNPIYWDNTPEDLMLQLVTLNDMMYTYFTKPTPKVTQLQNMLWEI